MPDSGPRRVIGTLADLGVTTHRGWDWAAHDIADALDRSGHPADQTLARHPAVLDAADRLTARIVADLPAGHELVGDVLYGPPAADPALMADHAMRIKERAGYAEVVADTGLWQPPDVDEFPQVRIEGRADRITPTGHHVPQLAAVADVEYWAVYGIDPDGLADWHADFATLADARRHAVRWQRPVTLVCTDHLASIKASPATTQPTPSHLSVGWADLAKHEDIRGAAASPGFTGPARRAAG